MYKIPKWSIYSSDLITIDGVVIVNISWPIKVTCMSSNATLLQYITETHKWQCALNIQVVHIYQSREMVMRHGSQFNGGGHLRSGLVSHNPDG